MLSEIANSGKIPKVYSLTYAVEQVLHCAKAKLHL